MNSDILKSIQERLKKSHLYPHQVASLGEDIFILKNRLGRLNNREYEVILKDYTKLLDKLGLQDILLNQIQYAIRIAKSQGELEYEEMHKLFSLCDEISALKNIGLKVDESINKTLKDALEYRFQLERGKAKLVAQDKFKDWKKDYWWYSENLKSKKKQDV